MRIEDNNAKSNSANRYTIGDDPRTDSVWGSTSSIDKPRAGKGKTDNGKVSISIKQVLDRTVDQINHETTSTKGEGERSGEKGIDQMQIRLTSMLTVIETTTTNSTESTDKSELTIQIKS